MIFIKRNKKILAKKVVVDLFAAHGSYGMRFSCNHGYYCIGVMTSLVAFWIRDSYSMKL